jgi:4-nitrophenyl phosphatase
MTSIEGSNIKSLVLDMDGVLWRETDPIGDLSRIFARLKERYSFVLATNNGTKTIQQFLDKLASFKVELEPWQIITSAQAVAEYLLQKYPQGGPVYVFGESGLVEAMESKGFYHAEGSVLAVVAGMNRDLTFEKLRRATLLIRKGVPFIGTNPDLTYPTPEGLIPGAGSLLTCLELASGVKPVIIGKPEPYMYTVAKKRLGTADDETLAVGDRLTTDILGAQRAGCKCALVLSGVTTLEEALAWRPLPDYIAANLAELIGLGK